MTRYRVLPYKKGSRSAKALSEALGGKVLKLEGSTFKPLVGDVIINWGCAKPTSQVAPNLLVYGEELSWENYYNKPSYIIQASNKLSFFNLMKGSDLEDIIPAFWTNKEEIKDEDFPVVCRTILSGHSGSGIVIADNRDGLVAAPLYVKYVKKKDEYRVHVGLIGEKNGYPYSEGSPFATIIAVQRKARRIGFENPNWQVRNHSNGFVYVRENVNPPQLVIEAAKKAFEASSLDFGAVDVIWNEHEGKAYVLEINTAPGLEGQTVIDYANFFKGLI